MTHFRAAVVEAGLMGSMQAAILDSLRDVEVVAVVDSDEARARHVAATFRGAQPFPTLEAAFVAGPVDFGGICTRDHLHREPVLLGAALTCSWRSPAPRPSRVRRPSRAAGPCRPDRWPSQPTSQSPMLTIGEC